MDQILEDELDYHMENENGVIMDGILLQGGIKDFHVAARAFIRCATFP